MLVRLNARLQETNPTEVTNAGGGSPAPTLEQTIAAQFDAIEARGASNDGEATADAGNGDASSSVDDGDAAKPAGATRTRDAAGKFAKPSVDGGKAGTTEAAAGDGEDKDAQSKTPQTVESKFPKAPRSWSNEEQTAWDGLPESVRATVHRREENFLKGLEQYRGKASNFDALHEVIAPHAEVFKNAGQNAIQNIGGLLDLQRALYTGNESTKIGTLLQIASNVGIQPAVLIEALQNPQSQPAQDPRYDSLSRELQETRAMLGQMQSAPIQNQVQSFLGDPKNEFLGVEGVQETMISLVNSGVAKSMQEAYDKACKLNDTVVATLTQRQAEADAKGREAKQKEEAKRKADLAAKAAKAASINVRPRGVTTGTPAKKGTLEDTIGATWDAIAARQGG